MADTRYKKGHGLGSANVRWAGDSPSQACGRLRARALFPGVHKCEVNGCSLTAERHHKDGNTGNNDRSNISFLCNKHHKAVDGRMWRPEFHAWRKGRTLSAEHRAKIGAALVGRFCSDKTRAKLSAATTAHYVGIPKPTACPHGHQYDEANTRIDRRGVRCCRACARERAMRGYWAIRRAS